MRTLFFKVAVVPLTLFFSSLCWLLARVATRIRAGARPRDWIFSAQNPSMRLGPAVPLAEAALTCVQTDVAYAIIVF